MISGLSDRPLSVSETLRLSYERDDLLATALTRSYSLG